MWKHGALLATVKMQHHSGTMGDYANEHGIYPFRGTGKTSRLFGLPACVFGDTMEVVANVPEIGVITCRSDDGRFYQVPLLFVEKFTVWDDMRDWE